MKCSRILSKQELMLNLHSSPYFSDYIAMCFTSRRVLIKVERERIQKEIEDRLKSRIETSTHNPPDDYAWEELWAKQIPYMRDQAEQVHLLFTDNKALCENDFSFYEDEYRFFDCHAAAAKDLALYLTSPHEDCPMTWSIPKWNFFIRKLFHRALRNHPRPNFRFPPPPRSRTSSSSSD